MNKNIIKSGIVATAFSIGSVLGLSSCETGTSPGETNVGRGEIVEPEETEGVHSTYDEDTTNLEKYYDDADHENHTDNDAEALGDGAYDGEGDGLQRGELDQ